MIKNLLLVLIMSACAPIAPTVSKQEAECNSYISSFNSVDFGDSADDVEAEMHVTPTSEVTDGVNMTQVYKLCHEFTFYYENSRLIAKSFQ